MSLKTIMPREVNQKRAHIVSSLSCKTQERCKLICSDRRQISCLGKDGWEGQEGSTTKVHKETFGVMNMFIFFTMEMVSLLHAYVKTY